MRSEQPDLTPKKRRKKSKSPTARSLAELRKRGWTAQVVEQTIPRMFIKRDLFGVIDIVAIIDGGIVGIQATSGDNHASRITKILAEPRAKEWLEAGGRLEVWSWRKGGAAGVRKLWALRVQPIAVEDFHVERKDAA